MRRATVVLATAATIFSIGRADAVEPERVAQTYVAIAAAMYADSAETVEALRDSVDAFLAAPSQQSQDAAKAAWKNARASYLQTEVLRFGNPLVDEWEGKVNAWPLDEGLIDYVASSNGDSSDENPLYRLNVIASSKLRIGRNEVDAATITPALLQNDLAEALGVEKNVATGYHAIEFLLWGQDLHGTGPGAGARPWTDYSVDRCTGGNCDRRRTYLQVAVDLLVTDLRAMSALWSEGGQARAEVLGLEPGAAMARILTGIGSLSYGEMAGERMKLGLLLHDPEEEQDCFSDNTHNANWFDEVGIVAVWTGHFQRLDRSIVQGPSLADLMAETAPNLAAEVDHRMQDAQDRLGAIRKMGESGQMAYDQMLAADNTPGNAMIQAAIDALVAQTRAVEKVVDRLGVTVTVEGSDSLDDPATVAP